MEAIKVSVDVNINFSESAKAFLSSLFCQQPKCNTEVAKAEQPKPTAQSVPTQSAQHADMQEPAKPMESIPAVSTHSTSASSAIKIDHVRKALAEKVNDHRAAIKAKLEELGAPSVTKLDPAKYDEMYNFLTQL